MALLLTRVAASDRDAALYPPLDLGRGVLVLAHEDLNPGIGHGEEVLEHRVLGTGAAAFSVSTAGIVSVIP